MKIFSTLTRKLLSTIFLILTLCWFSNTISAPAHAQEIKDQRKRGQKMLETIKEDIKDHYFDLNFRGLDLDEHFKKADEQIRQAVTGDQIYGIIAYTLMGFDDSHTFFIPPVWSLRVTYGWDMQMIGDKCYVVSVLPESDAAAKGLKVGDTILSMFDIAPTRDNLWQIRHLFYRLRPLRSMNVVAQSPGGKPRRLELFTKVEKASWKTVSEMFEQNRISHQSYYEVGDELFIWKMPDFSIGDKGVDEMMKKVGQRKALILDLRANGGGLETTLQRMLGYFSEQEIKVGDTKGRKGSKPLMAKSRGDKVFKGQLVVLVDSRSASAAEVFARTIQLEKRGTVMGDRTSGRVTGAIHLYHTYHKNDPVFAAGGVTYGVSVTVQDLIMTDGKSLERVGVIPDKLLLPTATDLQARRDTVLIQAADFLGVKFDPAKAGPFSQLDVGKKG